MSFKGWYPIPAASNEVSFGGIVHPAKDSDKIGDVWNDVDFAGSIPYEPTPECPKCRSHRTELRKLFTNDYIHCFNCDGGTPTPKEPERKKDER